MAEDTSTTTSQNFETRYFYNESNSRLWTIQAVKRTILEDRNQRGAIHRTYNNQIPVTTSWGPAGKGRKLQTSSKTIYSWSSYYRCTYGYKITSLINSKLNKGYREITKGRFEALRGAETKKTSKVKISESENLNSFRAGNLDAEDAALCIIDFD